MECFVDGFRLPVWIWPAAAKIICAIEVEFLIIHVATKF